MMKIDENFRLTDELERQLMLEAIEEQFRFKPMQALKQLFARLAPKATDTSRRVNVGTTLKSAN